ncbi:MAG: class I SAM-dependent methyltransferase [Alphaproteobacteria bacterium]|nr:class I SAM-dependent methyltransferase [Alphaproteobacteria bacterium]
MAKKVREKRVGGRGGLSGRLRAAPSTWVAGAVREIPGPEDPRRVLDFACGRGRHTALLLRAGHRVLAVDQDVAALRAFRRNPRFEALQWDLEQGDAWPFADERFKGIVVSNYLYRPKLTAIFGLLGRGGVLVYETFGTGNARYGRPSNPDYLAEPGEIAALARAAGLSVAADAHVIVDRPRPAVKHRVIARKSNA